MIETPGISWFLKYQPETRFRNTRKKVFTKVASVWLLLGFSSTAMLLSTSKAVTDFDKAIQ